MARHGLNPISNTADVLDSRDIIARIEELEGWEQGVEDAAEELRDAEAELNNCDDETTEEEHRAAQAKYEESRAARDKANDLFPEGERDELKSLRSLAEEAEGYADDWRHGATLIRDSYFKEYAQQYADDIGAIDKNATWPLNCIDWDEAADELKGDFTEVDFDGVSYWVR